MIGVDQTSHLSVALCCGSRVEAWPEHPEKHGSHHREQVAGPVRPSLLAGAGLPVVEHPGHSEAEVGAEHVDEDRVPSVHSPDVGSTDDFVDVEEHDFDEGHQHELDWCGCSEKNAKGDQHGRRGEISAEHGGEGDVDPRPVWVAVLVVVETMITSTSGGSRSSMVIVSTGVIVGVEEAVDKDGPLDADDGEQHVQRDRSQAVPDVVG